MRILVTGAMGFIGSHFVSRCLAEGHSVVALVRSRARNGDTAWPIPAGDGVEVVEGDLLARETLEQAVKGVDRVCHFAAAFQEAGAADDLFRSVNVIGTRNLALAAADAGVSRVVLCGTAGIYGQRVAGVVNEDSPARPWNIYEVTKLQAEDQLRSASAERGLEYVIVRPSTVYGPGDRRLLKLFRAVAKGRFPLFGDGRGRRHMVYVADLVEAFLVACTAKGAAGLEVIAAGPRATTLRELLETLARTLGRSSFGPRLPLAPMRLLAAVTEDVCTTLKVNPPLYRRRMDFYLNDVEYDATRAQTALGWAPRIDLDPGLRLTHQAYRSAGWM